MQIDGVQCGFLLEQIGVVNVQGEIADLGKNRLPAIVIVDLEIFGHQTSKGVQRKTPDPDFQTESMEFLGEQGSPVSSEPLMIIIVGDTRKE